MADQDLFHAQFALESEVNVTLTSINSGTEMHTGALKMANAWGVTVAIGTRPKPAFFPWHRVYKIEKA